MKLVTVILAAGKGKRMGDPTKSKVLYELDGKPMISYVVSLGLSVGSEKVIIIVGHEREAVMSYIRASFPESMDRIEFAIQEEQLGTGHAVMQAEPLLRGFEGNILILSGDVPILQKETVEKLENSHRKNQYIGSLLSAEFDNPFGYGRILRDENGEFHAIREEKDTSESEKAIKEINSGIYLVQKENLFEALSTIKTDNAQKEYYLTDIFLHFSDQKLPIGAIPSQNPKEILGVNTQEQLQELEKILRERK